MSLYPGFGELPDCPVHDLAHRPAFCESEGVFHPVVCKKKAAEKEPKSPGTHLGRLDKEARERRAAKNARLARRDHPHGGVHELDMPVPGSGKRVNTRLFTRGNRQARGRQ